MTVSRRWLLPRPCSANCAARCCSIERLNLTIRQGCPICAAEPSVMPDSSSDCAILLSCCDAITTSFVLTALVQFSGNPSEVFPLTFYLARRKLSDLGLLGMAIG